MVARAPSSNGSALAEQVAPGLLDAQTGIEGTLRDLSIRGELIKTSSGHGKGGARAGRVYVCIAGRGYRPTRCSPTEWPAACMTR